GEDRTATAGDGPGAGAGRRRSRASGLPDRVPCAPLAAYVPYLPVRRSRRDRCGRPPAGERLRLQLVDLVRLDRRTHLGRGGTHLAGTLDVASTVGPEGGTEARGSLDATGLAYRRLPGGHGGGLGPGPAL